jgi:hypothetical protein
VIRNLLSAVFFAATVLLIAHPTRPAENAPARGEPTPQPDGTIASPFGEPVLRVRTARLARLGNALTEFLVRVASGESTSAEGDAETLPEPHAGHDHGHDYSYGPQPHAAEGERPRRPENRLVVLVGLMFKIPPDRLHYFLQTGESATVVAFEPDDSEAKWCVGAYLPINHFDELVRVWQEDEVVRHLITLGEDGLVRMEYPRYGPFFFQTVPGGGVTLSWEAALATHLADRSEELWNRKELDGPHVRIRFEERAWRGWTAGLSRQQSKAPSMPPFVPPHLQTLARLPSTLLEIQEARRPGIESGTVDLHLSAVSLGINGVLSLPDESAAEPAEKRDGESRAKETEAETHSVPLAHMMPRQTVAFLSLPDVTALHDPLKKVLPAVLNPGRKVDPVIDLIVAEGLEAAEGPACIAYVRGEMSEMNALLVFRSADHAGAQKYATDLVPHLGAMMSAKAMRETVAVAFGLKHVQVLKWWEETLATGEAPFGARLKSHTWFDAGGDGTLFAGGVYPVDFVKAVIGETVVQARIMGMPMQGGALRERAFRGIEDSPNPLLFQVTRRAGEGYVRFSGAVPAGAYVDISRLLQRMIFGWQEIQGQLAERWMQGVLDRMAEQMIREEVQLDPGVQDWTPGGGDETGREDALRWEN